MAKGGRSRKVAAVLLGLGALAASGGCSKLQASLDRQQTVTLGDVAARVSALEQRVADLEASSMAQSGKAGAGVAEASGAAAGQPQAQRVDAHQFSAGDRAVVSTSFLNVRAQPDLKASKIGTLKEGAVVQVLAVQGDWAKVRYGKGDAGLTGWVARQFIERQE